MLNIKYSLLWRIQRKDPEKEIGESPKIKFFFQINFLSFCFKNFNVLVPNEGTEAYLVSLEKVQVFFRAM